MIFGPKVSIVGANLGEFFMCMNEVIRMVFDVVVLVAKYGVFAVSVGDGIPDQFEVVFSRIVDGPGANSGIFGDRHVGWLVDIGGGWVHLIYFDTDF